jgi:hypothetical protein
VARRGERLVWAHGQTLAKEAAADAKESSACDGCFSSSVCYSNSQKYPEDEGEFEIEILA